MTEKLTPGRVRAAWAIALAADFVQIVVFPVFAAGFASPLDDALDVAVGIALLLLLGWHWAFLPAFLAELVPGLDLVPTWTASVFFATRRAATPPPPQETFPRPVRDPIAEAKKVSPS